MKNYRILVFICWAIIFFACREKLFDLQFGLRTDDYKYLLVPTHAAGEIGLKPVTQTLDFNSILKRSGTKPENINSVIIKKVTAFMDFPENSNFDVLDSGILVLSSPGIADLIVAEFNNIPDGVRQFDIIPKAYPNVLGYAEKKDLTLSGKFITNGPLNDSTNIRIKIEYEVSAQSL